jgi:hypothetical protein
MAKNWIVQFIPARDFFHSSTLTIPEWVQRESSISGRTAHELYLEHADATLALGVDPRYLPGLREDPRVGYDISTDKYYFFYKMDNNGNVFIVSEERVVDQNLEI